VDQAGIVVAQQVLGLHTAPTWQQPKDLGIGGRGYRLRKQIVEPVFGQIKQAMGFRQFLLRGLAKVQAEWTLVCTAHNLLKLIRASA
jgi:hypothetical protein